MEAREEWLGWHFLPDDGRLQYEPHTRVEVGVTLTTDQPLVLCVSGFHASRRAIDALSYAPGSIACRVRLGGEIVDGTGVHADRSCARERTVLAMADATAVLHEFACRCAEQALRAARVEDDRYWRAVEVKRKWLRGEVAVEADAVATWATARDARDAARAAVEAAAWAALPTVRIAAWATIQAIWDAAWAAARSEQDCVLEGLLLELLGLRTGEEGGGRQHEGAPDLRRGPVMAP